MKEIADAGFSHLSYDIIKGKKKKVEEDALQAEYVYSNYFSLVMGQTLC